MLDLRFVRENIDFIKETLDNRQTKAPIDEFSKVDNRRRKLIQEVENLKKERNEESSKIGSLKSDGRHEEAQLIIDNMGQVAGKIKELDEELKVYEDRLEDIMLKIPNIPHKDVPIGSGEKGNISIREWGELKEFNFDPKPHWELGVQLDILDFEKGAKVSGSRFTFLKGLGARLERALINFMLHIHISEHGYNEVFPPFMVSRESMLATGQLPKFEDDAFKVEGTEYFLIPTAEVPITNMYRDQIIDCDDLPIYHVANSACFRSEAGSHGRDTRGIIRQHQFNKVEMVKFVKPEDSYIELDKLLQNAEVILKKLGLPYRVMSMCTGDLGFTAARKFDIEVWLPSYKTYREISSCSNFEDFQARRAKIKYRPEKNSDAEFIHTLNGSGLAIGRTVAAILENYQNEDGSIIIPDSLRPYMGGIEKIENN